MNGRKAKALRRQVGAADARAYREGCPPMFQVVKAPLQPQPPRVFKVRKGTPVRLHEECRRAHYQELKKGERT